MTKAAASDVIRLVVLSKFGGVWADASTLCPLPLDAWLPYIVGDTRFFAFRNFHYSPEQANQTYPISSWFLYGDRTSAIVNRWKAEAVNYWTGRQKEDAHFWVHYCLFRVF